MAGRSLDDYEKEIARGWRDFEAREASRAPREPLAPREEFCHERTASKKVIFRRRYRHTELRAIHFHLIKLPWDDFIAELRAVFDGRDVFDPDAVSPAALGSFLQLTSDERIRIEDRRTADWRIRFSKKPNYRFRFCTIAACDVTPDEHARRRRKLRNAAITARRKAERVARPVRQPMENATMTTTTQKKPDFSYRDVTNLMKAATTARREALFAAIPADAETNIAELMDALCDHRAWRDHAADRTKFRQCVVDRLNELLNAGRITDRHELGPRGARLRIVRRRV
jgi:hypothetical protein